MPGPKVAVVVVSVFNTLNTIDYRLTGGGRRCVFSFLLLEGCCWSRSERRGIFSPAPPSGGRIAPQLFPFMYSQYRQLIQSRYLRDGLRKGPASAGLLFLFFFFFEGSSGGGGGPFE